MNIRNLAGDNENIKFAEIFRSGKMWEFEMVVNTLSDHGIPYFQQEQNISGLKVAKPIAQVMAPGTWWAILVPAEHFKAAEEIISGLPVEREIRDRVWPFNPRFGKSLFKISAWTSLILTLIFLVLSILMKPF